MTLFKCSPKLDSLVIILCLNVHVCSVCVYLVANQNGNGNLKTILGSTCTKVGILQR